MSHTIKNYVLGKLKRYIRYNSLKITFLKIRTKFFSRLRNRGFKKIWLKKQFATLKYEDREKLMTEKRSDSSLSHSACQTLLEKKAASLKTKRSRLADNVLSNNDKSLFPMIPHQRGVTSGKTLFRVSLGKNSNNSSNNSRNNKPGNHGRKRSRGGRRTTRKNDESKSRG